jgi:hypothetical protein
MLTKYVHHTRATPHLQAVLLSEACELKSMSEVNMSKSEKSAGTSTKTMARSAAGADPVKESRSSFSADDGSREARISEAAFFKAAARGFAPGHEWDDWLTAEKEIDAQSGGEGSSGAALRPDPNSRIWSS